MRGARCAGIRLAMITRGMSVVWIAFLGLLILGVVRRHGWEYVPVLLLITGVRWYAGADVQTGLADGLTLASVAGVWVVTGITRV